MKSVLIIGADGMLGYAMVKYFKYMKYDVTSLTREDFEIITGDIFKLRYAIDVSDFVVNCAGVIKPRIKDTKVEDVFKVNTLFPLNLANICNLYDTPCFHITTDCVYSGKDGMYNESAYFDAEDIYGLSKCGGDFADCMVLRTSIIGEEKERHSRSLLSWALSQKNKTIDGYTNHYWNGMTTLYLAEVIESIMFRNLYRKGIFHIFSDEAISKFELLRLIDKVYKLNITINATRTKERIDRSLTTEKRLCKEVVKKDLGLQVKEMKQFFGSRKEVVK